MFDRITTRYLHASRGHVLGLSALLLAVVVAADISIPEITLGFLYHLPIVFAAGFLPQVWILVLSIGCALLREAFTPFPLDWETPLRLVTSFLGFAASGLFVSELSRNRRIMAENVTKLEEQIALRKEAQEQLAVLINTSPAAILIIDAKGTVLLANESAEQLLGFNPGTLVGAPIHPLLPAVETVPVGKGARSLRSTLECRGQRRNGSVFLAQLWFSTYDTGSGPRVAAIVLDASEPLRDREGAGLSSLMHTSRVLIGAVSHSVRNLCAASKLSYANLARIPALQDNEDLKALGTLIRGLESISTMDLVRASDRPSTTVDLNTLLDELRVVIEPSFEEASIELVWDIPSDLPPVVGEHYGLLHAILNLTQNSERALYTAVRRRLAIMARSNTHSVVVSFVDTAGGVRHPEQLFKPFQVGSAGTGLGLYVSRAIVRSFDGDLNYEPSPGGSCFSVTLRAAYNRNVHAVTDGR